MAAKLEDLAGRPQSSPVNGRSEVVNSRIVPENGARSAPDAPERP